MFLIARFRAAPRPQVPRAALGPALAPRAAEVSRVRSIRKAMPTLLEEGQATQLKGTQLYVRSANDPS